MLGSLSLPSPDGRPVSLCRQKTERLPTVQVLALKAVLGERDKDRLCHEKTC